MLHVHQKIIGVFYSGFESSKERGVNGIINFNYSRPTEGRAYMGRGCEYLKSFKQI
jgi:hypothetical protein